MTQPAPNQSPQEGSAELADLPKAMWAGLVVGIVALVFPISYTTSHSVNGVVTSCETTNFTGFIATVVCLVCIGLAWSQRKKKPAEYQSVQWQMTVGTAVLGLLAILDALSGFGVIVSAC